MDRPERRGKRIQVARLAGLPSGVVTRAREILGGLERDELSRGGRPTLSGAPGDPKRQQLGLFVSAGGTDRAAESKVARRLKALDVDETTPRQALELLGELKKLAEKE